MAKRIGRRPVRHVGIITIADDADYSRCAMPITSHFYSDLPPRSYLNRLDRHLSAGIPGIHSSLRLDQQDPCLLRRLGAMFDALRNDEQLPWIELDIPIAQVNRQVPVDHEKEIIGLVMLVPDEWTFDLHDQHLVVVEIPDDSRFVRRVERRELLRQFYLVTHRSQPPDTAFRRVYPGSRTRKRQRPQRNRR